MAIKKNPRSFHFSYEQKEKEELTLKMNILRQCTKLCRNGNSTVLSLRTFSAALNIQQTESPEEVEKLYKTVELELRGNDPAVLKSFAKFATTAANHLEIECKSWNLRKPLHDRYTVLKSAHVHKKHRVQYEFRTYFTFVQYKHITGSTTNTMLEYVERNLPEGVSLKATRVEIQKLPEHLTPPNETKES